MQLLFAAGLLLTLVVAVLAVRALTLTHAFTVRWTSREAGDLVTTTTTLVTGVDQFFVRHREERFPLAQNLPDTGAARTGIRFEHASASTSRPRGVQWIPPAPADSFLGRRGFAYNNLPPIGRNFMVVPGTTERAWAVPVWFIVVVLGGVTALAFWRVNEGARRRARLARGLCPACAYDLRGAAHERCPECGEPVTVAAPV
jgi:hypothetical protein